MKQALIAVIIFSASPAFAHHEVIVATSMMPIWPALVAILGAAFDAWKRAKKMAKDRRYNC